MSGLNPSDQFPLRHHRVHSDESFFRVERRIAQYVEVFNYKQGEELLEAIEKEKWLIEKLEVRLNAPDCQRQTPPKGAELLLLLIPHASRETLLGDLEEEFHEKLVPRYGLAIAKFYFWWHSVLAFLWSFRRVFDFLARMMRGA